MDGLSSILFFTISMSTPLVLCVLGGLFAYKANVLNIAMEGMMNMGAFASVFFIFQTHNVLLGILLGVLAALLFGLLFSFFGITLKGNLTVVGLAVNLLIQSLIPFVLQVLFNTRSNLVVTDIVSPEQLQVQIPIIKDIPFLGAVVSGHTPLTYLSVVFIILACVLLYKTRFGKYVRVVGENDQAAESVGIKSNKIKYMALLISALMAALAGVNLSVESLGMYTIGMVAGRGFIALAAIYCGRGKPLQCCLYAVLFGLARAIQIKLTLVVDSATASLVEMLPYLFIVIIMFVVGFMKNKNNLIRGYKYD